MPYLEPAVAAGVAFLIGLWAGSRRSKHKRLDLTQTQIDMQMQIQRLKVDALSLGMLLSEWETRFGDKTRPMN